MQVHDIKQAYRRLAPVYDGTFGRITAAGRRRVVEIANRKSGRLLEVGVGTGLSLRHYGPQLRVVGIDLSTEMLTRARKRAADWNLRNVLGLYEMDAENLQFGSDSFDVVVAMYALTVVPNPEKVMTGIARVLKPGGELIVLNHFSKRKGLLGKIEESMEPFADRIGWHPQFEMERLLQCPQLFLRDCERVPPFGLFTVMRFSKFAAS